MPFRGKMLAHKKMWYTRVSLSPLMFLKYVFLRKTTQPCSSSSRKDKSSEETCKDCENQFRRQLLIDRLVSDTILTKAWLAGGGPPPSQLARELESEQSASGAADTSSSTIREHTHQSRKTSTDQQQEMERLERIAAESRCAAHQIESLTTNSTFFCFLFVKNH